jgi:hypothetical protein
MEEWRRSAELAQHVLDLVDARVADLPAGTRIYLVDFPYRLDGPFLPWSVMLLEHSVQGWLDLRFPAKHFDAVGLSYAVIGASEAGVEVEADPSRHVHVRARGALSGTSFPWSSQYGKGYEGTLYRYVGPHRGRELDIELPGEDASDPLFLVWTVDRVELVRGWTWRVASAGSGAADGEPTSR